MIEKVYFWLPQHTTCFLYHINFLETFIYYKRQYTIMNKMNERIIRNLSEYNGQYKVTIPKRMASKMGLRNKDVIEIKEKKGKIIIEKLNI